MSIHQRLKMWEIAKRPGHQLDRFILEACAMRGLDHRRVSHFRWGRIVGCYRRDANI